MRTQRRGNPAPVLHLCVRTWAQDVAEALRRLPPEVLQARDARLRRAIDLDMKHDHLHGELLAKQTPDLPYLQVRGLWQRAAG